MEYRFRKAVLLELDRIWAILSAAIDRRREDGSNQWQDGYPNSEIIKRDIEKGSGFVMTEGSALVGYCAVMINDEPEYAKIEGKWLSGGDFVVFHRVAISEEYLGKGLAKKMLAFVEEFARANNIYSIKADTNFNNPAMISILEKSGYVYCGEVWFRGSSRRAYEKLLV